MLTPKGRTLVDGIEDLIEGGTAAKTKTKISKAQDEDDLNLLAKSDREIVYDVQILSD